MKNFGIDTFSLSDIIEIWKSKEPLTLSQKAKDNITRSFQNVKNIVKSGKVIYGINTGFGPLCETKISEEEIEILQKNLLISHSVGVGEPISKELSRLMMICKVHALSKGFSGVSVELVEKILFLLNKNIIPVVPKQGSVGASGDLAPLSHLFLPLIGLGKVWYENEIRETKEVFQQLHIQPITLQAKEGLALINGTQFILAHAINGLERMQYLLNVADLIAAVSLEAYQGSAQPFKAELHQIRPYPGNIKVAERMLKFLHNSENSQSHIHCERVQDPYSFRCVPQVHGASRNAWNHLKELTEIELNSVTDNPIVLSDEEAISGGNFHGQPLALPLDYATFAMAETGNISDRRCFLLLEGKYGLPKLLTPEAGLNSGFMIPQYTTAALVTENKTLCFPASADSVPTSLGQEDHVSMGSISGRKFNQVIGNVEKILAIELMFAAQGFEFRRPLQSSKIIEEVLAFVRTRVPKLEDDRLIGEDIQKFIKIINKREL